MVGSFHLWFITNTGGKKKYTKVTTIEINLIKVVRLGELPSYKGW